MDKYEKEVAKTVLSDEEQILKELKQVYTKALQDVQSKIADLNARTDLQNAQSIVHQKKFQEAIENQIKEVLNNLETKSYDSIHGYLEDSYINGYVGHMYILQNHTGCTCVTPINQKKIVDAYTNESKISTDYYSEDPVRGRVAEDVELLKRRIKSNVSRGIISGQTWAETAYNIATGMNNSFSTAMNDAMRIARTEGHKVNQIGFVDAGDEAISKGADIVKQWDATLDQVTRPWHQEADGQIREWKDKFIVMGEEMTAPGLGGSARNVCNCRCQLLQRARWALDDAELEELKKRAEYFDLDKSTDFKDFKEKFLKLPENSDKIRVKNVVVPDDSISAITGMTEEIHAEIKSAIESIQKEYKIDIDDIIVKSLGENFENVPFQFNPANVGGFLEKQLIINADYNFNGSIEEYNARVMRNYNNKMLASKSIADLIFHELVHIMTFQECVRYSEFEEMESIIRGLYTVGVSRYADASYDGAETISEAAVKIRNGEPVPEKVKNYVATYIDKWKLNEEGSEGK